MILIADSGSTKTDWTLMQPRGADLIRFTSPGLNPNMLSDAELRQNLQAISVLRDHASEIQFLYFYGAGCTGKDNISRVSDLFQLLLPSADVHVDSDMVGAVRAVCDHEPCVTAILGTGANSCYFDGTLLQGLDFSIGYILGDEGSGAWMGKQILKAYSYNQLPQAIHESFFQEYALSRENMLEGVYRSDAPSAYLASFAPFLLKHADQPYINELLRSGIRDFIRVYLNRFPEIHSVPVHFIGSIAAALETMIRELCAEGSIVTGKFLRSPMEGLIQYHLREAGKMYGKDEII